MKHLRGRARTYAKPLTYSVSKQICSHTNTHSQLRVALFLPWKSSDSIAAESEGETFAWRHRARTLACHATGIELTSKSVASAW